MFAFHIFLPGHSQENCNSVFSGRVVTEDNEPIIGATIFLPMQQLGQISDSEGNFRFPDLCEGRYKVQIQFVGYEKVELNITIKGEMTRVVRLKELVQQLEEVVIQHHDATHTEHATHIVQLSERELSEKAGKSLGHSLRSIAGVNTIQSGPGIFKPVIHGVHSQRILILNHGIRQEGQQWGAEHAPEIDPFIASNIVVIKDASAIKYGTDALGGVVVINPPALPEKAALGGTLNTVFQSNGRSATVSGTLEGGLRNAPGLGWRLQGTWKKTGDFHTPKYNLTNTGVGEANFSAAAGYHKEKLGIDVFFSRFQTETGILRGTSTETIDDLLAAMERPIPLYTKSFSYSISEPRQEVSHNLLKLNGHLTTDGGEWRWQYGFQNNNRKEFDMRRGNLSERPVIDLRLDTHSADVEWETHHSEQRTITLGVSGTYQSNQNIYGTQRIPFIPNFTSISSGVFAISKLYLGSWTVDVGARYDFRHYDVKGYDFKNSYYNASFAFNNVSASAGVVKTLHDNQTISLNVSSSWRPPHVAELYSVGKHQSAAAIEYGLLLNDTTNEVMDIEEVAFNTEQALKLVASYRISGTKFFLEATPYVNYIFNYIYLRAGGVTQNVRGVYPYFRYAQTDALFVGSDIHASWRVHRFVSINPKVSLLSVRDVLQDDFFVFIPSNRYDFSVRYERPVLFNLRNFYVESAVEFVSRQNRSPDVVSVRDIHEGGSSVVDGKGNFDFMSPPTGYWLLNLSAGFSLKTEKVQYDFRIGSDNTLNTVYREYTNRFRYYADDLGRNIFLSFKCIF